MKKLTLLATIAAVAAVAFPAAAAAGRFGGVVVAKQARRHALVVASRSGVVRTVRTRSLRPRVGARVVVRARLLRDGTYRAGRIAVRGRAHRARLRGVVVRRLRGRYLVSTGRSVLSVRTARFASMSLNDEDEHETGDELDETVTVGPNGVLEEEDAHEVGHTDKLELEGKVVSFTPATATTPGSIVLQTEGAAITIVVPAGFQLSLQPNQQVELKVLVQGTTFTLIKAEEEDEQDEGDDGGDDD